MFQCYNQNINIQVNEAVSTMKKIQQRICQFQQQGGKSICSGTLEKLGLQ